MSCVHKANESCLICNCASLLLLPVHSFMFLRCPTVLNTKCGDGWCDAFAGETCRSCPADCPGQLTGGLGQHVYMQYMCGMSLGLVTDAC
jgi:hypothetical protein